MDDKILTLHPEGKAGANISKAKYDAIRTTIVEVLTASHELTFDELRSEVERRLGATFEGSISWYVTTVKLDLEARGVIVRAPQSRPQRLQLAPE